LSSAARGTRTYTVELDNLPRVGAFSQTVAANSARSAMKKVLRNVVDFYECEPDSTYTIPEFQQGWHKGMYRARFTKGHYTGHTYNLRILIRYAGKVR